MSYTTTQNSDAESVRHLTCIYFTIFYFVFSTGGIFCTKTFVIRDRKSMYLSICKYHFYFMFFYNFFIPKIAFLVYGVHFFYHSRNWDMNSQSIKIFSTRLFLDHRPSTTTIFGYVHSVLRQTTFIDFFKTPEHRLIFLKPQF